MSGGWCLADVLLMSGGRPADVWRTSCWCLADVLLMSGGRPADVLQTSCWCLTDVLLMSDGRPADVWRTSCWCLADALLTSYRRPADVWRTPCWRLTDVLLMSGGRPADVWRTSAGQKLGGIALKPGKRRCHVCDGSQPRQLWLDHPAVSEQSLALPPPVFTWGGSTTVGSWSSEELWDAKRKQGKVDVWGWPLDFVSVFILTLDPMTLHGKNWNKTRYTPAKHSSRDVLRPRCSTYAVMSVWRLSGVVPSGAGRCSAGSPDPWHDPRCEGLSDLPSCPVMIRQRPRRPTSAHAPSWVLLVVEWRGCRALDDRADRDRADHRALSSAQILENLWGQVLMHLRWPARSRVRRATAGRMGRISAVYLCIFVGRWMCRAMLDKGCFCRQRRCLYLWYICVAATVYLW